MPISNDPDRFNITPQQFVDRTLNIQKEFDRALNTIHLTLTDNKWCALIGENLQVGITGFGDDPIKALSDLYINLRGIEFIEIKNSSGDIYSTSIKSIAIDPQTIKKHQDFIDAYGNAIADLDANGLDNRESVIADLVAEEAAD